MPAPGPTALPSVTALMGAYNYGRYIGEAITSAMEQDYPAELLDLVIVDDGSTDDTAAIVAEFQDRHPGRITFIRQSNAGATAATNRARAAATGDLIALLDADDVWLPSKTRRQVSLMQERPELGMVFSQMRVIDADGATLQNGYGHREPMDGNQFARVLWENVAVQSSLIVKAALFEPIPAGAPYADWWLCLRAAQFERVEYLREDLVLYRWHDANLTGGVGGAKALREAQKGIDFQRWVVRSFEPHELTSRLSPAEMAYVWTGLENQAQKGLAGVGSHFGRLATVTDVDRQEAAADARAADEAAACGDLATACFLSWRARMGDPYDSSLRLRFTDMAKQADAAAKLPDPLEGSLGFNVLTDAEFLLSDDAHLSAYAEMMRPVARASLVIDASRMEEAAAADALHGLIARCGIADDDPLSLLAVVGEIAPSQRFRLSSGASAVYGTATAVDVPADPPVFSPETLGALRALAEGG